VTYSANGGEGAEEQVEVRQGFSISLKECDYTKDGYKFGGWCEEANGNGTRYRPNATYEPQKDVILYAIWDADLVTINFDSNNGSNQIKKEEITRGKDTKLPKNDFENEGYVFVEWNTNTDGTGTSYQENGNINLTQDSIILYAIWKEYREVPEYWEMIEKTEERMV